AWSRCSPPRRRNPPFIPLTAHTRLKNGTRMHSKAGSKQARMNSGRVAGTLSRDTKSGALLARERVRRLYRPDRVRILFVGEAPPASGRFFYRGDSGLYRAVRDTFKIVDPSIHDEDFLAAFQALGCYLIDLCPDPVDRLDSK